MRFSAEYQVTPDPSIIRKPTLGPHVGRMTAREETKQPSLRGGQFDTALVITAGSSCNGKAHAGIAHVPALPRSVKVGDDKEEANPAVAVRLIDQKGVSQMGGRGQRKDKTTQRFMQARRNLFRCYAFTSTRAVARLYASSGPAVASHDGLTFYCRRCWGSHSQRMPKPPRLQCLRKPSSQRTCTPRFVY